MAKLNGKDILFSPQITMTGGGAVNSVNGQTGDVVLDAEDVGAYEKPVGGIPKTDLATAVQTSLDNVCAVYIKTWTSADVNVSAGE